MDNRKQATVIVVAFAICMTVTATGGATAGKLITGKQIKNGTITEKDLSKGLRKKLSSVGAQGSPGAKGDSGAKGDPGPTLIRGGSNVENTYPIGTVAKSVVIISDDLTGADFSGSYSGSLVHPAGLHAYLTINVQAHVASVSGTGVSCGLETQLNSGAWNEIAKTGTVTGTDAYMNSSFPSFTAGNKHSFRVMCKTTSGSGTARGELGVVAGPVGG